jgi:hypothetical protein
MKLKDISIQNLENLLIKNQNKNNESNNYAYNTMVENKIMEPEKKNSNIKNDNENIIYNKLNNITEPTNNQIQNNNININSELNKKYFDSKKEENMKNNLSEFISDEGEITDLDEMLKHSNIVNNRKDEQTKVVKKETDDLAEIANQIEEYNQSNRKSGKKNSNIETSDSNNLISHSNQAQKNESTAPEFDLNKNNNDVQTNIQNLEGMEDNENVDNDEQYNNEENENNLNNENNGENMEIIDNYDDKFYNDINNINDIDNEYENYDENINYEQGQ